MNRQHRHFGLLVYGCWLLSCGGLLAQLDSDGDGAPDDWEAEYSLDPDDPTDGGQDPDGDGVINFLEYAFGAHPRVFDAGLGLRIEWGDEQDSVRLNHRRRTGDPQLVFELQCASSLNEPIDWQMAGLQFVVSQSNANQAYEVVTYRQTSVPEGADQTFLRLSVRREESLLIGNPTDEFEAVELPGKILLHTGLENEASIAVPQVGVGGESNLGNEDFVVAQDGSGARFEGARFVRFPVGEGVQKNLDLNLGEVEFWFQPNFGAGDSDDTIHSLMTVGPFYDVPRITLSESDEFRLTVLDRDWVATSTSAGYRTPLWLAGEWVHIRAAWDRSNLTDSLQLFVNGERVDTGGAAGGWNLEPASDLGSLFIGVANEMGEFPANGVIDSWIIRDAPSPSRQSPIRNAAPFIAPVGNQSGVAGQALTFLVSANDRDGDTLRFTLAVDAPVGATIDPSTGVFIWEIGADQELGNYSVTIQVSDDRVPPASSEETVVIAVAAASSAVDGGGMTDMDDVYQPAEIPLQPVGVPFVDPVFGTSVLRVSDASERGGFESQIYNQLQAFSSDNRYILLTGAEGYLVRRLDDLSRVEALDTSEWNVPRWHPTLANTLVHYDSNEDTVVRVQFTDVDTLTTTTVFTFPAQYHRILGNPSFEELSHDGRWMAGIVTRDDGASVIFSVDLENQMMGAAVPIPDIYATVADPDPIWGELEPDWVGVSPLGNYLMVQWTRDDVTRASGLESWEIATGAYVGRVTNHRHHGDLGLALDGTTEIFVTADFSPPFNSDGQATVYHELPGPREGFSPHRWLRSVPWTDEDHISMQGPPGVGVVSWGNLDDTIDAPYEDELFLLRTDGSIVRLLHHRSTVSDYWVQPRASISRDGRYVIFASDWGRDTGGQGDPYIIDLQPGE